MNDNILRCIRRIQQVIFRKFAYRKHDVVHHQFISYLYVDCSLYSIVSNGIYINVTSSFPYLLSSQIRNQSLFKNIQYDLEVILLQLIEVLLEKSLFRMYLNDMSRSYFPLLNPFLSSFTCLFLSIEKGNYVAFSL